MQLALPPRRCVDDQDVRTEEGADSAPGGEGGASDPVTPTVPAEQIPARQIDRCVDPIKFGLTGGSSGQGAPPIAYARAAPSVRFDARHRPGKVPA